MQRLVRVSFPLLAGGLFLASAAIFPASPATARPQYSVREGMYCNSCHVDPAGGGLRHSNGFSYALGRHAWEVEPKFEEWKVDPEITKGVRLGADLRYAGIGFKLKDHYKEEETAGSEDYPQAYAPYGMQGSIYFALSPLQQLTLYYNLDLAAGKMKQRDWFGMLRGQTPLKPYVKAGMIRSPYGLRLEDHTPFVRGPEIGPPGEIGIMDLDPRFTYPGVEIGAVPEHFFIHLAYQDEGGVTSPNFQGGKLNAKSYSGKAGILRGPVMAGVSGRFNGRGDDDKDSKSTRYGAFAQVGGHGFAISLEGDAGKDQPNAVDPDLKVKAAYLTGELYSGRAWTFRGEINYRDSQFDVAGAGKEVARRYGLGAELNPIPFFRLSANIRYVANSTSIESLRAATKDEIWEIFYAVFSF